MTGRRPRLRAIEGAPDLVRRRQRFEAAHPEVTLVPPASTLRGDRWLAIVPMGDIPGNPDGTTIGAWQLGTLLDQLDDIYPPQDDGGTPEPELTPGQRYGRGESACRPGLVRVCS